MGIWLESSIKVLEFIEIPNEAIIKIAEAIDWERK